MPIFHDARLKIDRAEKHIADIKVRIERMHETNTAVVEINPNTGGEVLKHDFADPAAFSDLALIVGDAFHNLNCALDYTWLETIKRVVPAAVGKFAKFPVRETVDELEAALRGREIHIASPPLFELIVDQIKPYDGGNFGVWQIHHLDIRDKHRLLIPILSSANITGIKIQDERGEVWPGDASTQEFQHPPYYISFQKGLHVKDKGKLRARIVIRERGISYPILMPDTISLYSQVLAKLVEIFESFLES